MRTKGEALCHFVIYLQGYQLCKNRKVGARWGSGGKYPISGEGGCLLEVPLKANTLLFTLYNGMEWSAWVYSVDMLLSWHLWGSIQTSFTPRRSCQLHSTLRGTLQVTPLSFAASGLGLERLSKCGKSRHHGTVCFNIFICIYKWSDGMSEIGVVQFLVDVQEHALQPFFKVHFTWGNDWCWLLFVKVPHFSNYSFFHISVLFCSYQKLSPLI